MHKKLHLQPFIFHKAKMDAENLVHRLLHIIYRTLLNKNYAASYLLRKQICQYFLGKTQGIKEITLKIFSLYGDCMFKSLFIYMCLLKNVLK